MRSAGIPKEARGPVDLLEEAFELLRGMSPGVLGLYFIGALPFMLGLLYCWEDMRRGAFASDHLPLEAVLMGALFLWMKGWQGIFAAAAMERLKGEDAGGVAFGRAVSIFAGQGAVQATGLFVLPAAACLLIPFGWAYAFYQNFTVLGTSREPLGKDAARALRQSGIRPGQNHAMLGILLVFSGAVFLNLLTAAVIAPWLVRSLLGIESAFTRGGLLFELASFLPVVTVMTFLCVDPVVKCAYVLRCFYGLSRTSGEDLRVAFAKAVRKAGGAALALMFVGLSWAAPRAASPLRVGRGPQANGHGAAVAGQALPHNLNASIDRTLKKPEYSWRRAGNQTRTTRRGFLAGLLHGMGDLLKRMGKVLGKIMQRVDEWLRNLFGGNRSGSGKTGILGQIFSAEGLLILLILLVAGLLVYLAVHALKRKKPVSHWPASGPGRRPDLSTEDVSPDQLPEEGWLSLAEDLRRKGELRLALRALFLAGLACLGETGAVGIARFKSNREYLMELSRRRRERPELPTLFETSVRTFEKSWYGDYPVSADLFEDYGRRIRRMKSLASETV